MLCPFSYHCWWCQCSVPCRQWFWVKQQRSHHCNTNTKEQLHHQSLVFSLQSILYSFIYLFPLSKWTGWHTQRCKGNIAERTGSQDHKLKSHPHMKAKPHSMLNTVKRAACTAEPPEAEVAGARKAQRPLPTEIFLQKLPLECSVQKTDVYRWWWLFPCVPCLHFFFFSGD